VSTVNAVLQQCYPRPVQSIAVLILGRFGIPHLAIGQVLSGIWAKQCSQPGGSEKLLSKLSRKTNPNMGILRIITETGSQTGSQTK
jgi:hypothetical protein